jgi:hypothetical protein
MFGPVVKCLTIPLLIMMFTRCSNSVIKIDHLDSVELNLRIVPEDTLNGYVLQWNDKINPTGADENRKLRARPYELYCTVTSSASDTLGYYIGSSSPRNYLGFVVNKKEDNEVYVQFHIGINYFSTYLEKQDVKYIDEFNELASDFPKFEKLSFDLSNQTYKWMYVRLQEIPN